MCVHLKKRITLFKRYVYSGQKSVFPMMHPTRQVGIGTLRGWRTRTAWRRHMLTREWKILWTPRHSTTGSAQIWRYATPLHGGSSGANSPRLWQPPTSKTLQINRYLLCRTRPPLFTNLTRNHTAHNTLTIHQGALEWSPCHLLAMLIHSEGKPAFTQALSKGACVLAEVCRGEMNGLSTPWTPRMSFTCSVITRVASCRKISGEICIV